ncbi:MAG: MBL fold metallo-hydrolase [Deltaproteobacteria bacterium]|nr:MBL fold metallo-hydrolase [Deltaproteobacteria bacterium]
MIIDRTGWITDRILKLGRKESCVYLLKGRDEYTLLGGGMVHIVPEVNQQLAEFNIAEEKIKRLVILHAHFDHCGIIPYYQKRWPWAAVAASQRARELLATPKVVDSIAALNQATLASYNREQVGRELDLDFRSIEVTEAVKGGDLIPCGEVAMEVIDVPGHSTCSIAVYVPQEKAMFASDAGGIPFGEDVFTAANSNFDQYLESIEKIFAYEIDVYLPAHHGVRTEEDGQTFMRKSRLSAQKTRDILEEAYARTGDVKKSVAEVTDRIMARAPQDFLPKEIIAIVIGQMMSWIAKQKSP